MTGRVAAALLGALSAACAGFPARVVEPVDEWDAYRRFRVAPTLERRLGAAYEYLRERPRGWHRAEVEAWFGPVSTGYVTGGWDQAPRLRRFLAAVPEGPAAARARTRLVELDLTEGYARARAARFDAEAERIARALAGAERGRRALTAAFVEWSARLAAMRSFGGRTHELEHELIHAYRLTEPAAVCTDSGCRKALAFPYAVPEAKAQSERLALLDVVLLLQDGAVVEARLAGPELFTRLGEALRVGGLSPGDVVGRAEAIGQAAQLVAAAAERSLPASRCAAEAVSPVVLHRACDGVELEVIAALDPAEDDLVVVRPRPARAP